MGKQGKCSFLNIQGGIFQISLSVSPFPTLTFIFFRPKIKKFFPKRPKFNNYSRRVLHANIRISTPGGSVHPNKMKLKRDDKQIDFKFYAMENSV